MRKACTPLVKFLATLAEEEAMLKDALYFRMLSRKWRLSGSSAVIGRTDQVKHFNFGLQSLVILTENKIIGAKLQTHKSIRLNHCSRSFLGRRRHSSDGGCSRAGS